MEIKTMDVITKAWCAENPQLYFEFTQPPKCCPICMDVFTAERQAQSPLLGDAPSRCRHFACEDCWMEIMARGEPNTWKCAICREDVGAWMSETFPDAYTPPPDSVGSDDMRELAAGVLRHCCDLLEMNANAQLPHHLMLLSARILRHVPTEQQEYEQRQRQTFSDRERIH